SIPVMAPARPSSSSAVRTSTCAPSASATWRPAYPAAPITRCTSSSLWNEFGAVAFRVSTSPAQPGGQPGPRRGALPPALVERSQDGTAHLAQHPLAAALERPPGGGIGPDRRADGDLDQPPRPEPVYAAQRDRADRHARLEREVRNALLQGPQRPSSRV